MREPLCLCGHEKSRHIGFFTQCRAGLNDSAARCSCEEYRPANGYVPYSESEELTLP